MIESEVKKQLSLGEDSKNQFKIEFSSIDKLASEICAFANSQGGRIIVGADDTGIIKGLSSEMISHLDQWISNAASQKIDPPLSVTTSVVEVDGQTVLVIDVPMGKYKPYSVGGNYWIKNGADKRKARREELIRLMQSSNFLYADEMSSGVDLSHLDTEAFTAFYERVYGETVDNLGVSLPALLHNLKLVTGDELTIAGLLLFGKSPESVKPQFTVKATSFYDTDKSGDDFIDKENIGGMLTRQFKESIIFLKRNLRKIQKGESFNVPGTIELPLIALEEALSNALVHRDYLIDAPVFIDLYSDRLEIVSPGALPNTVRRENITYGIHVERNPVLLSFMEKMTEFRYSGRGSGIPRLLRVCKDENLSVDFIDDRDNQTFTVVIQRPVLGH